MCSLRRLSLPIPGVERLQVVEGALGGHDPGAGRKARVAVGVVAVIVRVDHRLHRASPQSLGQLVDAGSLVAEGHGVDDDRAVPGGEHADVAAEAEDDVDVGCHLLGVERGDEVVDVDGGRAEGGDQDGCGDSHAAAHRLSPPDRPREYTPQRSERRGVALPNSQPWP
jgi:hypothetical protein